MNKLLLIVVFLFVLQSIKWKFAFILKIPYNFSDWAGERESEREGKDDDAKSTKTRQAK